MIVPSINIYGIDYCQLMLEFFITGLQHRLFHCDKLILLNVINYSARYVYLIEARRRVCIVSEIDAHWLK